MANARFHSPNIYLSFAGMTSSSSPEFQRKAIEFVHVFNSEKDISGQIWF